ncbi:MAG: ABC transporter permease, partial [Longimicrobiales bacterium]
MNDGRLQRWARRALYLRHRRRAEREMDEEFRTHVELEIEANLRRGMSPNEARRRALLGFGGVERFKEEAREARGTRWLEDVAGDVRYAVRQLRRSPGFATVAIVTLALGIGANSAIFSAVNAVLLEPLEYHEPERLFFVYSEVPAWGNDRYGLSPSEYRELQELSRSFSDIGGWRTGAVNLSLAGNPVRVTSAVTTAELFRTLGVPARIGRAFTHEEDVEGAEPVVAISSGLWRSAFGSDPAILGRRVEIDGEARTVVGVMPERFDIDDADVDVWLPARVPGNPTNRGAHFLSVVGRLAPGVSAERARVELNALLGQWGELRPSWHVPNDSTHRLGIVDLREHMVGDVREAMLILLGAVAFVLLIACANVANLLLAKAEGRRREIAVRAALGAGRGRLLRQFVTEGVVLATAGGATGLLVGYWGLTALLAVSPDSLPRMAAIGLDLTVLLVTLGIATLIGLLFGLAPLLHHSPRVIDLAFRGGGERSSASAGQKRLRRLLVVAEMAMAVVLVIGSGLLIRSFAALQAVELGFDPSQLVTFGLYLPEATYPKAGNQTAFFDRLTRRLEALQGVQGVAAAWGLPPL